MSLIPRPLRWLSAAFAVSLWILIVAIPLVAVMARVDLSALLDPTVLGVARITVTQALLSTVFSLVIGLPLGLWIGSSASPRAFNASRALLGLPYGVPTVVAASAWIAILGRSGFLAHWGVPLDISYSLTAVIVAHVFFNAPWIALIAAEARRGTSRFELEAAATLGAGPSARFRHVVLPSVFWEIASATAHVFALCAMSFALVMILGGGPPVQTLETALYSRVRTGSLDLTSAAACALWELVITLVPWALVLITRSRVPATLARSAQARGRSIEGRGGLWIVLASAFFFVPYLAVFAEVVPAALLASESLELLAPALSLSLQIAFATALGSVAFAITGIIALRSIARHPGPQAVMTLLLTLPAGISVLVLGLGAWLAYERWIDPFEGSLLAIVAIQVALFFPLAFRVLWPVAQKTDRALLDAALTLGASPSRAFATVEWPRWRGPLLTSLALVAGGAIGEVAAVSLFYSEKLIPLPLLLSRWMGQYRFDEAHGLAAILLILSAGTIAIVSFGAGATSVALPERVR